MAIPFTAKAHFELCLSEQRYYINARSHCRLAKLYEDFDQQKSDVSLTFYLCSNGQGHPVEKLSPYLVPLMKVPRVFIGIRIKGRLSEEMWRLLKKLVLDALGKGTAERAVFSELSFDSFDQIITGLSMHFSDDVFFMTQLQLFILDTSSEEKYSKITNRALNFLIDKATTETDLEDGVSVFHVLIAAFLAPHLLEQRVNSFRMEQMITVFTYALQVAVSWPYTYQKWSQKVKDYLPHCDSVLADFSERRWDILWDLATKFVSTFNQGTLPNTQTNPSSCDGLTKTIECIDSLKQESKELLRLLCVWRAYSVWREHVSDDEMLVWLPDNKWDGDVDKIIDEFTDGSHEKLSPPNKRSRNSRERRVTLTASCAEIHLVPSCTLLDDAYKLCTAAVGDLVSSNDFVESANDYLKFVKYYPNVHKFISESLIFKLKSNEAVVHLNERLSELPDGVDDMAINIHLLCANTLERNFADAYSVLVSLLPQSSDWSEREDVFENQDINLLHMSSQVYTSTTLNHENDELLGSLLILSQINFYVQGYRFFNRIMRHIEAKGSLNYPGLGKYISNITILEELARIQDFCSEYVSIQIAAPQVHRRIGQSTRHSVRGTRDGQKHCLEEQIRKEGEAPLQTVVAYFTDNRDNLLQILKK
ncbi:unnamed protein product [Enterobius vermicularis]|uniref:TPR_REGION domain-containing protein n=1 Tax=Enterobius vermicularis TaxID=51028 RepID=A0A158QBC1_ENTVE|nr:unnamed protein product [Enterobius vermicularis]